MTQTGGPAAINGFLYQILHHLGWMAKVSLSGALDGTEIQDARLVLEPRNGGDAQVHASGVYLVEQYKTRQDGTWAIADIVSVLGDLRKAVPSSRPANACYRFVTDGRAGLLDSLNAFLDDVKENSGPDELDRSTKRAFGRDNILDNQEFFDYVVSSTRVTRVPPTTDERAAVFHLLRNFEMVFGSTGDEQAAQVERLLRRYVSNLGEERSIRERLIGVLMERLSQGETRLDAMTIDEILRSVGLSTERMRQIAQLAETLSAQTRRRLARHKYQATHDVRSAPAWPPDKPVLLIAGRSGAGKTWQLGRLLDALAQASEIAVLTHGGRTPEEILANAARDVWQTGLHETSDKTLIAVVHFLRELIPDAVSRQVTIAVDDVQDVDLARSLIRWDWAEWCMRLVLTVPDSVAHALKLSDDEIVHIHNVANFSVQELDHLLRQAGCRWAELPSDLKKILRTPILAGVFLALPYQSVQKAPRSEYEIFERHWSRITEKGRSGDEGIAIALADSFMSGHPYPLPRPAWSAVGLDEAAYARLDSAGWLHIHEDGAVEFAHDRLLNWAAAHTLVGRYRRGQMTPSDLGALLSDPSKQTNALIGRRLGYIAMDSLWLLAAQDQNAEALATIVSVMESSPEFGSYGELLYADLLPTLGQRAVPILLHRLDAVAAKEKGDYRVRLIGQAFASLAAQENMELASVLDSMLQGESDDHHNVAIAALTSAPDAAYLDRLWKIHQHRTQAIENDADGTNYQDHKISFAALQAAIEINPHWLRTKILSDDLNQEHVPQLGYLLNGLQSAEASNIWSDTADVLIKKIPANKPRSVLYCIARFRDLKYREFVIQHLSRSEDFCGGAALHALSVLDPHMAIERIMDVSDPERSLTRNNWLPYLLHAEADLTRQAILALAKSETNGRVTIETLFGERPDDINAAMLSFILRELERDLRDGLDAAIDGDPFWLCRPLGFLGRLTRLELISLLEAEAGGELERMLTAVACSRLRINSNFRDHVRHDARRVLLLIGGDGIVSLINRELESEHYWGRHGGLRWAFIREDKGIVERLVTIARRPVPRKADGSPESEPYFEFSQAMKALATLGADAALVDIIFTNKMTTVPTELAALRRHRGPILNTLTQPIVATLSNSSAASDTELLAALIIAWLSNDIALAPHARAILEASDPESKVAGLACIALLELDDKSDEFITLSSRVAHTKQNERWGLNALVNFGDRGGSALMNWLRGRTTAPRSEHEEFVIRALHSRVSTRAQAAEAAAAHCRPGRSFIDAPYDIAGEFSDPALREQILDKAFSRRSITVTEPLLAIKGLAKFDLPHAIDAIELALQSPSKIERGLCGLLLRLAPDTVVVKLLRAATDGQERKSLHNAIGRSLRRVEPALVLPVICGYMKGSVAERIAAARIAGWLPILELEEELDRLAVRDNANDVRRTALEALEFRRQEARCKDLFEAFRKASYGRQWALLTVILDAADPYLLCDREDPLWLGNILSADLPAMFEHHANEVLQQRQQKID